MSWAARRRFLIIATVGAIIIAFLSVVGIATFYEAPSCADGTQNQGEQGIDCGGPCAYLCAPTQQAPTVLFTKVLDNGSGRTDIVALIENKNASAAAKNVPYTISLYGNDQTLIRELKGMIDLPPGAIVPVFIPGAYSGDVPVSRAFLSVSAGAPKWLSFSNASRSVPFISGTTQAGSTDAPRITATLNNSSPKPLRNVLTVVLVRNAAKEVIAASQTIVPLVPALSSAMATFTWNAPFDDIPASIEVLPVIPLPD